MRISFIYIPPYRGLEFFSMGHQLKISQVPVEFSSICKHRPVITPKNNQHSKKSSILSLINSFQITNE